MPQSNSRFVAFISRSCVHPAVTLWRGSVLTRHVSVIYKDQNHKFVSEGFLLTSLPVGVKKISFLFAACFRGSSKVTRVMMISLNLLWSCYGKKKKNALLMVTFMSLNTVLNVMLLQKDGWLMDHFAIIYFFALLIFEWLKCPAHSHWQTRRNSHKKKKVTPKNGWEFWTLHVCNGQDVGRESFATQLLYFQNCAKLNEIVHASPVNTSVISNSNFCARLLTNTQPWKTSVGRITGSQPGVRVSLAA